MRPTEEKRDTLAEEATRNINARAAHDTATPAEPPDHRNDRRRFLILALMARLVPSERVPERIVGEMRS
jgi:hypothetical protein